MNRRALLQNSGKLALLPAFLSGSTTTALAEGLTQGNLQVLDPRAAGARGDGKTNDRAAIQTCIDKCAGLGGGIVYISPGTYLTGTVVLKSNVALYLEAGATILGSTEIDDYLPQPGPNPRGDANQKHLIFARKAENITICGLGVIDGQGPAFWTPSHRPQPPAQDLWKDVATYDWKALPRPSPMVELVECKNVHVEGVTLQNSAGWTFRPIGCDSVFIHGIRIRNPIYGLNVDGIDITCSQNVFISDCDISTADDAICLKSESPYGGPFLPTRNITVTNCVLSCCCNGFKIGTATRGGFENITFSNSVIENRDVPLNQRVISGIALEMVDGGWIEGVNITGIRMQRVRTPIFLRRGNRTPRTDGTAGVLKGVMIEDIHATQSILTNSIMGLPAFPIEDVTLSNIRIDSEERGQAEWVNQQVPEVPTQYPEARMFGRLPAYGFYCRHVIGLRMKDIVLGAAKGEARPAIVCNDTRNCDISGFKGAAITGTQPVIRLRDSRQVWIRDSAAPEEVDTFLVVEGSESKDILLTSCDLRHAVHAVSVESGAGAVTQQANITVKGEVQ
jgi:polygalacturonase